MTSKAAKAKGAERKQRMDTSSLMEQILSNDNLNAAYLQVVRNKGAAGVVLSRKLNDAPSSRLFYAHFDSHRDISHFKSSCFCELFF